jgi:hypothetical protein
MAITELPKSIGEFQANIAEAKMINALFRKFFACMQLAAVRPGKGDFSKNFTKAGDGNWLPGEPNYTNRLNI